MAERRFDEQISSLSQKLGLLLVAGSITYFGCEGDTLYDVTPDEEAPDVVIVAPVTGSQVVAGSRVPIQVTAEDEEGVSSLAVVLTGQVTETIRYSYAPPRTSVTEDTAIVIPVGAAGEVEIAASALNANAAEGQADTVTLTVTSVDAVVPSVSLLVESAPRMELTDSIRVTVRAVDNPGGSGIIRAGVTAIVENSSRSDSLAFTLTAELPDPRSDTVTSVFTFPSPFVDPLELPDTLRIALYGFADDADGNCGGGVNETFSVQVSCDTATVGGEPYVVARAVAQVTQVIAVSGRTSLSPGRGILADILVDTLRTRVYASNLSRNRINIMDAESGAWIDEVWVGAEPWGLAVSADGDTLFVANSGGTSISFVSLNGDPTEDIAARYVTRNNSLFEITDDQGQLVGVFHDYSDRPQYIAQDAGGRLLFSTRPTASAPVGTARIVTMQPGWASPETKILVFGDDLTPDPQTTALAHVDSIDLYGASLEIFDHRPGFPDVVVSSGALPLEEALAAMDAHRVAGNSDILWAMGWKWEFERLALHDTTFVATSGDRNWVAFGEGGTDGNEAGRITLWQSSANSIHRRLLVADLVNNASERVTGLDLNSDGSFGSASGHAASYYWTTDMRLQGSVTKDLAGGAGAALHPDHPTYIQGTASSESTIAFVGQGDATIRILDTVHFTERGQIHIRNNIVSSLRASPPLPTDNDGTGRACTGPDCVVVKLHGITNGGGIVAVDVRRRDIEALQ